jgi:tRNA A-37 threonylcarbamoyl transferase component Bud32
VNSEVRLGPITAATLREAARGVEAPFALALEGGGEILVERLLRVLPGKRVVGEGLWQGERVLVKAFVAAGSARHWAKEKAGIEALIAAGVPTPELELAARLAGGGHVLLTRYLKGAETLAECWSRLPDPAAESAASPALEILRPAFATLGALHARGLVHDDLHLGNFLRAAGRVFVIDGDAVRVLAPEGVLAAKTANLALLCAQLPRAADAWREKLLDAYRSGGEVAAIDASALSEEVARARAWRLADYLGKTLRDCTLFAARRNALRFEVVRRGDVDRLRALVADPDRFIASARLLKDGNTSTVARVDRDGTPLVVKRYNLKGLGHFLSRFWRPTRAWHSWREGHRLEFCGVATPKPLALIEERVGPFRRRGFLINAYCPGENLLDLLASDREPDAAIGKAIVDLFTTLHELRISHGDMKATNLLWHEGRIVVIDLDAVVQHRSAKSHAGAWRRDRARFLRNWPENSVLYRWLDTYLPNC